MNLGISLLWDECLGRRGAVCHQNFRSASLIQYSQDLEDCLLLAPRGPCKSVPKNRARAGDIAVAGVDA